VRSNGQPGLENERNDAGPVEYEIGSEMGLHVMRPNVEHNEWECMQERKDKEGIGNPSVENLKSLVRNSREQCDPVRLTGGCTGQC
jgi:hypothetical protein